MSDTTLSKEQDTDKAACDDWTKIPVHCAECGAQFMRKVRHQKYCDEHRHLAGAVIRPQEALSSNPKLADLFGGCARCREYFGIIGHLRNLLRDAGCECDIGDGDHQWGTPEQCPIHRKRSAHETFDVREENRKICAAEGHVLGVIARPCLRCHEWFDPQYRASESENAEHV